MEEAYLITGIEESSILFHIVKLRVTNETTSY
jgi:hypothetical protein